MISDKLATFAEATALNTGGAGSYTVGEQIDLGIAAAGMGALVGLNTLYWVILVDTQFDSAGGAATAAFSLVSDDAAALSTPTIHAATAAIAEASGTPGVLLACMAVPITSAWQRYVGIRQTTAGEAFTAGAITSFLTPTPPAWYAYPQGAGASHDAT